LVAVATRLLPGVSEWVVTALGHAIFHVVGRRPEKKMIWTDAERNIAAVAHEQPGGNFAMRQFPGCSVGRDYLLA
jgi:hypothetical protein